MTDPINILAIGFNPALQKSLSFEKFKEGEVNRATSLHVGIGGKGQQFSKAAQIWIPGSVTVAQFLGGETGKQVDSLLNEKQISTLTTWVDAPTRTCTTLLDQSNGVSTELIEPSGKISEKEVQDMLHKIAKISSNINGIAFCGTFPPGVHPSTYASIAEGKSPNALVLLDGIKDVKPILDTKKVDIFKINKTELKSFTGIDNVVSAVKDCFDKYDFRYCGITDGPFESMLFDRKENKYFTFKIPELKGVVNPIGAGDTTSAVFLACLLQGKAPADAFRLALGAASASCLHKEGATYEVDKATEIAAEIQVTEQKIV